MSDKADIWMPLYIGDYLSATQHLSPEESGAYLHLLMHSWKNGPLPGNAETLRRIARVDSKRWCDVWRMLEAFFKQCSDGAYVQTRLESERAKSLQKKAGYAEKASNAARKRWEHASSNASGNASGTPQAMLGSCPSPSPSYKEQKQENEASPPALSEVPKSKQADGKAGKFTHEDVESIWTLWPNRGSKQLGLRAIESALRQRARAGIADPVADLSARVRTWLAWHGRQEAAGEFVPAIGYAQGWFGDRKRMYLDPTAEPPAPTLVEVDGAWVPEGSAEAGGWTAMRGEA